LKNRQRRQPNKKLSLPRQDQPLRKIRRKAETGSSINQLRQLRLRTDAASLALARRMALENNINLQQVVGTGRLDVSPVKMLKKPCRLVRLRSATDFAAPTGSRRYVPAVSWTPGASIPADEHSVEKLRAIVGKRG
jgi:hypothetical protein